MKKENRLILKQMEKLIQIAMKQEAKRLNYKLASNSLYERIDNYFIHAVWFVRFFDNQYQLVLRPYIKPYNYDTLFWKIIGIKENLNQRDAFRAKGAFVAPSFQWTEMIYEIKPESQFEIICGKAIGDLTLSGREFITKVIEVYGNFDMYLLSLSGIMDEKLLKMLAYINLNDFSSAMSTAQTELEQGRLGRFENEGIGINEYIVNYCKDKI